jgi:hypothetical protein
VSEEIERLLRIFAVGRHTRPPSQASVRRTCLTTLIALVVQFGLGMWLNLYVQVPAADQHAGYAQEIRNGPAMLTVHALVGTFLIGAAVVLLVRTIGMRNGKMIALASAGLGAILGAFAAGELFVRDGGESKASLSMAALTGIALLSYVVLQALTSVARSGHVRQQYDDPAKFVARFPQRPAVARPRPGAAPPMAAPAAAGWPHARPAPTAAAWPHAGRAAPIDPRQPEYWRGRPSQTPAGWNPASVPRPAYPPSTSGPQPVYLRAARPDARPRNAYQEQARPANARPWQPDPNGYYPPEW